MSLNSRSVIKLVDLLCEGPIEGVVDGKKGVFLNETPVNEIDDTRNYEKSDIGVEYRRGTKDQDRLRDHMEANTNVIDISQEVGENYNEILNAANLVKKRNYGGGEVITQITDPDTDSFQILFTIPSLFCQGMEGVGRGELFNATIRLRIFVKNQNSRFRRVHSREIKGISTSNYQFKTPIIELTGTPPYIIKVQKFILKNNPERDYEVQFQQFEEINEKTPLEGTRANRLIFTSLIERQDIRTAYPYTACVGMSISTELFPSLPSRSYLVKGLKVKIPHNATVRDDGSLEFQGSFSGRLKTYERWTTCPVCIFYNILTSTRYGCGYFIDESNLNWIDLYELARYSNQLVDTPDGKEPRFAINTVIGSQAEAYKVLQNLASVFRGMTYWGSNTVNVVADHGQSQNISNSRSAHSQHEDQDPVHLYTNSNVINGVFSYLGSSLKTRSSSVWVSYNDPENFYKPNVVVVEDYELIEKYGYNIKEIVAFGCSSKYQAQRMGQWVLNSEKLDGHTVSFTTGLDGLAVLPSQIFAVSDEMRAGARLSGRVGSGSTTKRVVTDTNYLASLTSSPSAEISVTLSDGTVEKKTILEIEDDGKIKVQGNFSSSPLQNSVYIIERSTIQSQKFRCIDVKDNNDSTYTITGLEHNDSLYDVVDNTTDNRPKLEYQDITVHNDRAFIPENLNVEASLVQQETQQTTRIRFSWSRGINAGNVSFIVRFRIGDRNKKTVIVDDTIFEIDNGRHGRKYFFEVAAVGSDAFGSKRSKFAKFNSGNGFVCPSRKALLKTTVPTPLP